MPRQIFVAKDVFGRLTSVTFDSPATATPGGPASRDHQRDASSGVVHVTGAGSLSHLVRLIATEIERHALSRGQLVQLDIVDFDAIAEQVAAFVLSRERRRLVDARTLALELGVARDWVYANAERLGVVRLGTGPRARLRFDLEQARRALFPAERGAEISAESDAGRAIRRRPRRHLQAGVRLIQGRSPTDPRPSASRWSADAVGASPRNPRRGGKSVSPRLT
jgi:hypothetical protein